MFGFVKNKKPMSFEVNEEELIYNVIPSKYVITESSDKNIFWLPYGMIIYDFDKSSEDHNTMYIKIIDIEDSTNLLMDYAYCGTFRREDIPKLTEMFEEFLRSNDRFFDFVSTKEIFKTEFENRRKNYNPIGL